MAYFFFSFSFSFFLFAKESDMIFVSLIEAIFFVNSFSDFGVVKKQQNIISPITLDSWQTVQMITKDFLTLEKNKTSDFLHFNNYEPSFVNLSLKSYDPISFLNLKIRIS